MSWNQGNLALLFWNVKLLNWFVDLEMFIQCSVGGHRAIGYQQTITENRVLIFGYIKEHLFHSQTKTRGDTVKKKTQSPRAKKTKYEIGKEFSLPENPKKIHCFTIFPILTRKFIFFSPSKIEFSGKELWSKKRNINWNFSAVFLQFYLVILACYTYCWGWW